MEKVIKRYLSKFDELNILGKEFSNGLPETLNELTDIAEDWLVDAYIEGFASAGYILNDDVEKQPELTKMYKSIDAVIEGQNYKDRLTEYYANGDIDAIRVVFDTEFHRNWVNGSLDRAKSSGAKNKTWVTVNDGRVRESHFYLENKKIPIDESFITLDGDSAMAPGLFESAENNVNCRCILKYS